MLKRTINLVCFNEKSKKSISNLIFLVDDNLYFIYAYDIL
jgi:hypothetical protein